MHDRAAFSCNAEPLDRYLKVTSIDDMGRKVAQVRVICEPDSTVVIGYYSLSATSIELNDLPEKIKKKMPHYNTLPAVLLGRLAVDSKYQGQGVGRRLLVDALRRCFRVSESEMGAIAVLVDAKDENAARFYEHCGFQRFLEGELRLFIPMSKIQPMMQGN